MISILLSALLLVSSSGIAYAQHFCGDLEMLTQLTLGEKHLSCGMAKEDTACGDEHAEDHDCCDNEYTQVTTDDNFSKTSFEQDFDTTFVVAIVLQTPLYEDLTVISYSDYDPPPLVIDIPVLYETFLI